MKLVIGNKCYSSWSFRPWILMRLLGIAFEEEVVPMNTPEFRARLGRFDGPHRVPLLEDGAAQIWESLAIMEYLAERFPNAGIWPPDTGERALARSVAGEMFSGFRAVRGTYPMNFGKRFARKDRGAEAQRDVDRITAIWQLADRTGPFLFGAFTAADAMYAPVVSRFVTYDVAVDPVSRRYMDAVIATEAYQDWQRAALAETWIVASDEIDEAPIEDLRAT